MARANRPSPGHGRAVQLRFQTTLTAEEYVSREAWRNASFPPCLKGRCRYDCGLMRHGTYGRKTPVPMRVARFDCRECRTTISRLPDFAAARRRGFAAGDRGRHGGSRWIPEPVGGARRLYPHRDELSNPIRDLLGAFLAVSAFLAAAVNGDLKRRDFGGLPRFRRNRSLSHCTAPCVLSPSLDRCPEALPSVPVRRMIRA